MTNDDTAAPDANEELPAELRDELVGPGRYPLRIQPAAAIQPGEADARRLLRVWFVRKSVYWLFFLGMTIGGVIAAIRHEDPNVDVTDPGGLSGRFVLLLLALALRFVVNWVALGLAFPLALAHEQNLSPRDNFGSSIGVFFDRLNLARSVRALRWTHHVRQVAQHRLGEEGRKLGRLDPILDIVNIASGVIGFVTIMIAGALAGV